MAIETEKWESPGAVFWRLVFHNFIEREKALPTITQIARAAEISEHTLRKQWKEDRLPKLNTALRLGKKYGIPEREILPFYRVRSGGDSTTRVKRQTETAAA